MLKIDGVTQLSDKQNRNTRISKIIITTAIIFCFAVLLVNPAYTLLTNKPFNLMQKPSQIFMLLYSTIWMLLAPLAVIKFVLKMGIKDFGLQLPVDMKKAFYIIIFSYIIITPPLIWFAKKIKIYYPANSLTLNEFIFVLFIISPFYYFAEEFFFRGFIFTKLWRNMRWRSVWFTEILFALAHIGKPGLEIVVSIPVGLILNYVVYYSRSILPAILIHYYIDCFVLIWAYLT